MKTLSLTTRLRLMALLLTLAMLGLAAYTALAFYESSVGQRLSTTRAVVTQALGTVQKYQTEATAGKISEAEAKAKAKAELMAMRYEGKEYVFITDVTAHMVAHPIKPEMDGTDQTNTKDPKGKQLFVEMANIVKVQGSGYVDYLWPRVGSDEPVPKRSYVAGFTPWGWVVGSGVYIDAVRNDALRFAGVTLAISLVVCALIFVFIHRFAGNLQSRFQQAEAALSAIAAGDLTVDVPIGRPDEIGRLMQTLCSTRDRLAQVMAQVRDATGNVGAASGEIALGNQDLSTRTEATAANLQRTAGSMSLLTTTVNRSTEAAREASKEAGSAAEVAQRGGQVVSEVVTTMQNIQDSSNRISEIIGTIDGIAFQTNILALNAAVEAARAGEQGRGFAVVAGEVRTLAQRSAAAAREIKTLIVTSAERVECGARLVGSAGSTMSEIVGRVQRVTEMINGISAASNEQSRNLGEIAGAVQQLDEVTQQNAALVEESAAAAQSLRDQSEQLSAAVGRFQLPA